MGKDIPLITVSLFYGFCIFKGWGIQILQVDPGAKAKTKTKPRYEMRKMVLN